MDVNFLGDEAPSPPRPTPSPGPPNLFTGPGGQLKNARRGRPTPSKSGSTTSGAVDLSAVSMASEQIACSSTPLTSTPTTVPTIAPTITNTTTTTSPVQAPSRSNSAAALGFDDDTWTNRQSLTKPVVPMPPHPRARSICTSDTFAQLAHFNQLCVQNPTPAAAPKPMPAPLPSDPVPLPVGYNQGPGLGSSPSPLGQHLQAQQAGLLPPPTQVAPPGPFAPILANQALLAPLMSNTTGLNRFVPMCPVTSPSFLGLQLTGFQPSPLPPLAQSLFPSDGVCL